MVVSTEIGRAIGGGGGGMDLLLAKGIDFRPLFAANSEERQGIRKWERAMLGGTASLLAVKLNSFYTLREAIQAIAPNEHMKRHVRSPPP